MVNIDCYARLSVLRNEQLSFDSTKNVTLDVN